MILRGVVGEGMSSIASKKRREKKERGDPTIFSTIVERGGWKA